MVGTALQRQAEIKSAALPWRTLQPHAPAHAFDQTLANRQPQAGAAKLARGGCVGLRKRIEYRRMLFRGNADAAVLHRHPHFASACVHMPRLHLHRHKTVVGKFHRVVAQVVQHLANPARVAQAVRRHLVGQLARHRQPFLTGLKSHAL